MDKMKFETVSLTERNIDRIAELFPNVVTEVKDADGTVRRAVDFDALKAELSDGAVEERECYEFTWAGKNEAKVEAAKPIRKTLRPCKEESKNWDTTQNLYIEGDNLDVLKLLQESYLNKVKMIYIDPPYNTGNDFVYADDFRMNQDEYEDLLDLTDEDDNRMIRNTDSNGRFHSDWCSMMYSRLKLARNLLTDDGVIFISIDDNEQANLKKICDEIFGSQNFVFQISWRRTDNQPNIGKVARVKEYILCFSRNIASVALGRLPLSEKAKAEYRYQDDKGVFRRAILLDKTRGRHRYPVTTKSGKILNGPWMKTEEEFKELDRRGAIYWTSGGDEQPYGKIYLSESKGAIPNDFWGIDYGTNQRASLEVENLFQKRLFDFPKPVSLVQTIVNLGSSDGNIILDFFSGSATTAHAVMQLNAEDGGNRKFIMVQLPEKCDESSEAYKAGYKNICEIGKERIRRAGDKIKEEKGLTAQNLDIGFRVLKLDSSNMKDVYYTPAELTQDLLATTESNFKDDRTDMDLLYGCLLDWGLELSLPHETKQIDGFTVHYVNHTDLVACFDKNVSEKLIRAIAADKPLRVVFRDSCFKDISDKNNIKEIFKALSFDTTVKVI